MKVPLVGLLATAAAMMLLASCSTQTPPPVIPMEDFFRNPLVAGFQLSPDGAYISFTKPYERRMNIHVLKQGTTDTVRVTSVTHRDIFGYFWKGNTRILYLQNTGGDENDHLFGVDPDGKNARDLTPFPGIKTMIVDQMKDNETDVLIGLNKRNPQVFDVYRLNTVTGAMTMVAENPGNITQWLTDHEYRIRIAMVTDGVNQTVLYRTEDKGPFAPLITTTFKETFQPLLFTFDNNRLYALSDLNRERQAVVEYDPATKTETAILFEHPEVDLGGLDYSHKRKVLTEISFTTWKSERKILDETTQAMYTKLETAFPGYEVYAYAPTREEDKFIVRVINDRSLGSYHLYDVATGALTWLADRNPWLQQENLAEMKPVKYTTRDGLSIDGYLTLPKGRDAKNLPVVVNPHGGPWARDVWGFNPEVQFLANRGYAVFQMNFRGSTGYGKKFWQASFKEWGKTMQDDITDGVQWLIGQGIADPKRVAIYGGSYGGYATLAGLAFTPDLYAAGVDYVGVSNMFTFLKTIPPYWKPYLDMFHEMVGDPVKDSTLLASVSPVFHVDKIKAPLFVAQGKNDPRVNIDESDQIVEALKTRGVAVEYMVKENEGHGFANEENRFDFYRAMEQFLAKHLTK